MEAIETVAVARAYFLLTTFDLHCVCVTLAKPRDFTSVFADPTGVSVINIKPTLFPMTTARFGVLGERNGFSDFYFLINLRHMVWTLRIQIIL